MSWSHVRKCLQEQIAHKAIYDKRGQSGEVYRESSESEIGENSNKRTNQRHRHAIDPGHKGSACVGYEKLEYESEREQKLNDPEKYIYYRPYDSKHTFVLNPYFILITNTSERILYSLPASLLGHLGHALRVFYGCLFRGDGQLAH